MDRKTINAPILEWRKRCVLCGAPGNLWQYRLGDLKYVYVCTNCVNKAVYAMLANDGIFVEEDLTDSEEQQ